MARQPRTRQPKTKFKKLCSRCGAEKILYMTKTGPVFQCSENITH